MSWDSKLYVVKLKTLSDKEYSKKLSLSEIEEYLDINSYSKKYDEYIESGLLYFTENLNTLAKNLNVDKIYPKGLYIMGIYGGEKKKGEEKYAGLVLEEYHEECSIFKFRLYNTKDILVVPKDYLKEYSVKVYKMIYVREINPFRIIKYLDIILSEKNQKSLKNFLSKTLILNERNISVETHSKVEKLINELHQPSMIKPLSINKYYVVYRRIRAFTATVFKPTSDNFVIKDEVGYIECKNEEIAYYYSAILNYLMYKVMKFKRTVTRTQYGRPILAIYIAGLSWNNIDEETKKEIIELSKELHKKAPLKKYSNQNKALEEILQFPEFKKLIELLDSKVNDEKIKEALTLVSGRGKKEK